jgi:integrase
VPKDVHHAFGGKPEVWKSLDTSDLAVARTRLQREIEVFETRVAEARNELAPARVAHAPYVPSNAEIEAAVREAHKQRKERVRPINKADRRAVEEARRRLGDLKQFKRDLERSRQITSDFQVMDVQWQAEALCQRHNWLLDEASDQWWALIGFVTRGMIEAAEHQLQLLEGRAGKTEDEAFSRDAYLLDEQRKQADGQSFGPSLSLIGLFDEHVRESKLSPASEKSFRQKVLAFQRFLGHDDARRINKGDVSDWKDHLLARGQADGSPLSAKTVGDTYLPAVKAALNRGVSSDRLVENVAAGVTVAGKNKKKQLRQKGFKDAEVKQILSATLAQHRTSLPEKAKLARRWIPWLCAYTGARVNEMSQLRGQDITNEDGIWCVRITPEAGGTKSGDARTVPLHPHLIDQGFLDLAKSGDGPIFFDPTQSRGGSSAHPQSKKVGERLARWVREEIGITDPNVQPNHAWRHRFKTIARDVRMDREIADRIQGHAPRTEAEKYGEVSVKAIYREIRLIPKIELDDEGSDQSG